MRIFIVIVNWNGWRDTIECLESVFRLHREDFTVIVCDNASSDESIERISEWAMGRRSASPALAGMACYSSPPVPKPVPLKMLNAAEVLEHPSNNGEERLILISAARNLGFAGGNNLGLKYILNYNRDDFEYVWLLNNDTVVHPDALTGLIGRMEEDPRIGMCGSKLCFYSAPHLIQARGGSTYRALTGRNRHIGIMDPSDSPDDRAAVERRLGYIVGASLIVSKRFLESVGLMNEDYFLYYEEIDWATRAKEKFIQGYAPSSLVFHKQGSSMGGKWLARRNESEKSFLLSDFYSVRNQVRFTRRYYPQYLPIVCMNVLWRLIKRMAACKFKRAQMVLSAVKAAL